MTERASQDADVRRRDSDRHMRKQYAGKRSLALVVLLLCAIGYFLYALRYDAGTWRDPGPGLFPRVVAVLLAITVVLGYLDSTFRRTDRASGAGTEEEEASGFGAGIWRVAAVAFGVVAYVFLAQLVGYVIPAVGLVWVTLWVCRQRPWWQQLLAAAFLAGTSYLLFEMVLGISLPAPFGT